MSHQEGWLSEFLWRSLTFASCAGVWRIGSLLTARESDDQSIEVWVWLSVLLGPSFALLRTTVDYCDTSGKALVIVWRYSSH